MSPSLTALQVDHGSNRKGDLPTGALADIAAERLRQVDGEGWTPEHDDQHRSGQMANAAAVYAMTGSSQGRTSWDKGQEPSLTEQIWPWDWSWFKPTGNPRRDLVKAGALIVAEIERLDRRDGLKGPSVGIGAADEPKAVPTGDAEGAVAGDSDALVVALVSVARQAENAFYGSRQDSAPATIVRSFNDIAVTAREALAARKSG